MSAPIRVFFTGDCEGFDALRTAVAGTDDVEAVGASHTVAAGSTPLAGGHVDCVLHATRESVFPATEFAEIRSLTRAPVILIASGGEAAAMLEQALEQDIADVLLLPQLTHNVVFAMRKAAHARRQVQTAVHRGSVITVFSPKGGTGKTVVATNVATMLAKRAGKRTLLLDLDLQFGDAAIMLGLEPTKTDLRPRRRPRRARFREARRLRHEAPVRARRPRGAAPPGGRRARGREQGRPRCSRSPASPTTRSSSTPRPSSTAPMLATLDRTDELLVLCGLDVPTLKNVRLALQTLEQLSFPSSRITYVLNRASTKVGLKTREVEDALEGEGRPRAADRPHRAAVRQPWRADRARRAALRLLAGSRGSREASRAEDGVRQGGAQTPVHLPSRGPDGWGCTTASHGPQTACTPSSRASRRCPIDPYAELKARVHHACIAKLGQELFKRRPGRSQRPGVQGGHRGARRCRPDAAHP